MAVIKKSKFSAFIENMELHELKFDFEVVSYSIIGSKALAS